MDAARKKNRAAKLRASSRMAEIAESHVTSAQTTAVVRESMRSVTEALYEVSQVRGEVPGEVPSPMTPSNRTRKITVYLNKAWCRLIKCSARGAGAPL